MIGQALRRPCVDSALGLLRGLVVLLVQFLLLVSFTYAVSRLGSALSNLHEAHHVFVCSSFFFFRLLASLLRLHFRSQTCARLSRKGAYIIWPARAPHPASLAYPPSAVRFAAWCCQARGLPAHSTSFVTKSHASNTPRPHIQL